MDEPDYKLLDYNTHGDYLDSFGLAEDMRYLRSSTYARQVASLGYRSATETMNMQKFLRAKHIVKEAVNPTRKIHKLVSEGCASWDSFLQELAMRERPNRLLLLSVQRAAIE